MFLSDDFLLTNQWSKKLYHSSAEKMPIIDYHCHLSPKEIYENKPFTNLTEAWLSGDHYKWRLMRACGVPEEKITGHASDYEKFYAWCQTVPKIIGNPLYTWTHLELKRFFQIDLLINEENALNIWEQANKRLAEPAFRRREMAKNAKVTVICTTDDPIDELVYHELLAKEEPDLKVLPAFRPDAALNLTHEGFSEWLSKLSHVIGKPIADYTSLITALSQRIDYFHQHGCRLSDHGLDRLSYHTASENELEQIFQKALTKETLTQTEIDAYRTETLNRLITLYHAHGWTMQLHLHAYRNCNTQAFTRLGPDTGYDGINDQPLTSHLQQLLDHADQTSQLPKTILYSLNPNDYPLLLALMGCFQKETAGKLQLGSGWWYNDTRAGMREQMTQLADGGVLGNFVGMLTDSRSFLSYTRHEYFRRVLCELIGEIVERGEAPEDIHLLGTLVEDICYTNARNYFGFFEEEE
ncbi:MULTISPECIES: glucuronate isomerase [Enterococcus]|uniref:Uronate isomerase n=1 Tax=Enterococcus mundtii TaxID=53346 RepID=A0A1V2UDI1_ENTMU|nr:glucuronate isomerase [Enterococcus mundtii]EOH65643.1 glucuronate isomerase [Enterococcus mundtii ATCC 882]EOU13839.1 glucuronate isomerase [Enterococcus mundtii ATCC 882]MCA6775264.1 glucuronate isomerase [Enterococcus mundtii]MRI75098.1 glucuronate isomerase [Enterococcus mundtii]ONN41320.1 uronate isomerase [Enterococcus mundtii]